MKKVVVTEPIHADGMAILHNRPDLQIESLPDCEPSTLRAALADAHAVLVRSAVLDAQILAGAPLLEVVSRHGVGCDNIDVAHLSARGIPVAIAAEANKWSVTEQVLMMMLSLARRTARYDAMTRSGDYRLRGSLPTIELAGRTVLVIGFGRIGRLVAPLCKAFGMRVVVVDIALDKALADQMGVESATGFRDWLGKADFVTLHVPLDESTRHLIGAAELAAMPAHSILINCARGGVVDEAALARALHAKAIAGAGVDVFELEPPPADHPLFSAPNTVLSPHTAASTVEGLCRMATGSAQNIVDALEGRLADGCVFNHAQLHGR
ncbi:MAG: hydroxyacid dehydrogenase [Burkholderiaceae bacterium]